LDRRFGGPKSWSLGLDTAKIPSLEGARTSLFHLVVSIY